MIEIGICDDDSVFIKYIEQLFTSVHQGLTFYEYHSGEELIQDMKKRERYDLLIVDIRMPGINGNETARQFRKQFSDTVLVFCSGVFKPTVESFETTPYRYWLKEYDENQMRQEICAVLRKVEQNKVMPYLMGKLDRKLVKLSPSRISYISIAKRGSTLHYAWTKECYTSSRKLAEIYEDLKDFGFVYAHNSYIVNLKYVVSIAYKELEFADGEKFSVSRARIKELKEAFARALSQKYEN